MGVYVGVGGAGWEVTDTGETFGCRYYLKTKRAKGFNFG